MGTDVMRGAGRCHEVGFYRSDEEFRKLIVPFVEEGVAAGQPVILGYDERKTRLLRSWLADPDAATFMTDHSLYATPAGAIANYWREFERHTAAGATMIRIAGDVPHEGNGGRFAGWDRYESAANTVWDRFPVWSRCLYDSRTTPRRVLDAAERTHPRIVLASGQYQASRRYQPPAEFAALPPVPHPIERSAPAVEMSDPTPRQVRNVITTLGSGRLPDSALSDLLISASEVVTNAWQHGQAPVTMRIWAATGQLVVGIHDTGPGPADPLAGLVPPQAPLGSKGFGLWVAHLLGLDIALIRSRHGFTVRIAADA